VLLGPASLLVQSFARLTAVDPGFARANVVSASVTLPPQKYTKVSEMTRFHDAVLQRLASATDVSGVAAVNWLPFGGNLLSGDVVIEGSPAGGGLVVGKLAVSPNYFRVIGIPPVNGRTFSDLDTAASEPVVVVTERAAARFWPGQDAVGKRLKLGFGKPADQAWVEVVGVVREVKQYALSGDGTPAIYVPLSQAPHPVLLSQMTYVVRNGSTTGGRRDSEFRDAVRSVDPDLPISRVAAMDDLIGFSVSEPRFRAALIATFAVTALLLVAAGLFGVLMYSVARRTREIGVRMAVGAAPAAVVLLVIREMLAMTVAGVAVGLTGALATAAVIRNLLFAIAPTDPATFAFAAGLVLVICVAASYVPARRAARIAPAVTLRAP
jgi:putative ABC transport system permease protein